MGRGRGRPRALAAADTAYATARLAVQLLSGLRAIPRRGSISVKERLAALPTNGLPVDAPVSIRWSDHLVPFVEASSDRDLAVGLGVVHAHLRLAQMEAIRHFAQGKACELLGALAFDIDCQLRALDLCRAVPAIFDILPDDTRAWLDGFVAGINHVVACAPSVPPDLQLLGLGRMPWTIEDVLAIGRLASADLNWMALFNALLIYGTPQWRSLWKELLGEVEVPDGEDVLGLARGFSHSGSNALAVAGWRSRGGAAIVAGDPHLDLMLPNLWLVGGMRSPSYHAVGLMIPGLPFIALGRNPWMAWAGTSLHAASSDLYDAAGLPASWREERIGLRWSGKRRFSVRETVLGPIVTDAPRWRIGRDVALRWVGHRPSDEITAMLLLNRARNWKYFVDAAARVGVPGQTFLYGDRDGHIGRCLAVTLPRRPSGPPADLLTPVVDAELWEDMVDAKDLPQSVDPPEGWLLSANLPPPDAPVAISHFHSPPYREERMAHLLAGLGKVTIEDVARVQRDVYSEPSLAMRDRVLSHLPFGHVDDHLVAALRAWNGEYDERSTGASAYELLLYHMLRLFDGKAMERRLAATWDPAGLVRRRLDGMEPAAEAAFVREAVARASRAIRRLPEWGRIHRLRLPHLLGLVPGLGRLFRYGDAPWPGGNETLMKAAHRISPGLHTVRYGANARFIADLSDLDRSRVVLLGGQDGWLGSSAFMDQLPVWQQGRSVDLPMRPETVRRLYPHHSVLRP